MCKSKFPREQILNITNSYVTYYKKLLPGKPGLLWLSAALVETVVEPSWMVTSQQQQPAYNGQFFNISKVQYLSSLLAVSET